jgi:hypothetical protein
MARSMSRARASVQHTAECGHSVLHRPWGWVNDTLESSQYCDDDGEYHPTSSSDSSYVSNDMADGCRPFHKVYRVDISSFPSLKRRFMQQDSYRIFPNGQRESDAQWERRRVARLMAAEEDRERYHVPVQVATNGYRRQRSSWLRRHEHDHRAIYLEVEDPFEWKSYAEALDVHCPYLRHMQIDWDVLDALCRDPQSLLVLLPTELMVELYRMMAAWQPPFQKYGWPLDHHSWSRPSAPERYMSEELVEKEPSWAWASTEATMRCERVPFKSTHRVHVMDKLDYDETNPDAHPCFTINVGQ